MADRDKRRLRLEHFLDSMLLCIVAAMVVELLRHDLTRLVFGSIPLPSHPRWSDLAEPLVLAVLFAVVIAPVAASLVWWHYFDSAMAGRRMWPRHWGLMAKALLGTAVWIGCAEFSSVLGLRRSLGWRELLLILALLLVCAGGTIIGILLGRYLKKDQSRVTDDEAEWLSHDLPVESVADNRFPEHRAIADRVLHRLTPLSSPQGGKPPNVAVIGDFGSGKTTICNFVRDLYSKPPKLPKPGTRLLFCRFEAWEYSTADAALRGMIEVVSSCVQIVVDVPCLWRVAERYLELARDSHWGWLRTAGMWARGERTPGELLKTIDEVLTRIDRRVVLFVDDLDRIESTDQETKESLVRALNQLQKTRNIQFVICVGPMESALGGAGKLSPGLDILKLTRFQEILPSTSQEGVVGEFRALTGSSVRGVAAIRRGILFPWSARVRGPSDPFAISGPHPGFTYQSIGEILAELLTTPRALKAAARMTCASWGGGLKGEINWYDLVVASALQAAEPSVWEWIIRSRSFFLQKDSVWTAMAQKDQGQEQQQQEADRLRGHLRRLLKDQRATRETSVIHAIAFLFPDAASRIDRSLRDYPALPSSEQRSCEQRLCGMDAAGRSYLDRLLLGAVPDSGKRDAPLLNLMADLATDAGALAPLRDHLVHEVQDFDRRLSQLEQFAALLPADRRLCVCHAILEWLADPENYRELPHPRNQLLRLGIEGVCGILRSAHVPKSDVSEWITSEVTTYAGSSPLLADLLLANLLDKLGCYGSDEKLELASRLRATLAERQWNVFVEQDDPILPALSISGFALPGFVDVFGRHPQSQWFAERRTRLTQKLVAEADSDKTGQLKAMIIMCLVESGMGMQLDEEQMNLNRARFDMDSLLGPLRSWSKTEITDPYASQALDVLVGHYHLRDPQE